MRNTLKWAALGVSVPLLLLAELAPQTPLGLSFPGEAAAIVGAPLTPMSYAGVARRTTRRVAYTTTAVAASSAAAAASAAAASSAAAAASAPPPPPQPAQSGPVPIGTVVSTLPAGCVSTPINNVEYFNCAPGVYYRAAFQGNNLVYVAAQP